MEPLVTFRSIHHLVLDPEANEPEFIDLVATFLRYMKEPEGGFCIVESGTYCGTTALCVGWTLKQFGLKGHVYTADPSDWAIGFRIIANKLKDFISYFQGDFVNMLPNVPDPVHMALIDCTGWAQRAQHVQAILPKMAPGGLIIIDDMNQTSQTETAKKKWLDDNADIRLRGHRGCSIMQVKDVDSDTVDHAKS
jgi:predicted O-methyltransferase YrrM